MALDSKLVTRTKQLQLRVATLTRQGVTQTLPDLSRLNQQAAGATLRTIAAGSVAQFGNLATQAAATNYEDLRAAALGGTFTAQRVSVNNPDKVDAIVGRAMSLYAVERFTDAGDAFTATLERTVSDLFRETMSLNTYDDSQATGFQRVASPNACAFCALVALNEYTSFEESGGYHDNCGCTTIPVFRGLGAFRPSYYEQFDQEYISASSQYTSPREILQVMRREGGRR